MARIDVYLFSGFLPLCCSLGVWGACASTGDGGHRSTVPVLTKGVPLTPPNLPTGWSVGRWTTREDLAKGAEWFDTKWGAGQRQRHLARTERLRFYTLIKDAAGGWIVDDTGDLSNSNVEAIWVDPTTREVGPAVEADIYCHAVDPANRATVGYKACTSSFAAPYDEGGRYWVGIDPHVLGEAVKQAGIIKKVEADVVAAHEAQEARRKAEETAAVEREQSERIEQAQRAKVREKERADLQSAAQRFRQSLTVGNETHCGMIVEVKRPIVKVQTMDGEKWLRVEQIYPPNTAPCRFFNHVYQEP